MCCCKKPEEVSGGSSGVTLLRVEEEPVAMFKLLLCDVPAQMLDVDSTDGVKIERLRDSSFMCNLLVLFSDEITNLKIARALSSSEVQYLTSILTRLENVWYSVFAACNSILACVCLQFCQRGDFTNCHLFCCFVDSFKDIHIVLVHVLLLVFWRSNRRRLPGRGQ